MEESIGYEALFSSDEWESLDFGEWFDDLPPDGFPYSENGPSAASSEYGNPRSETGSSSFASGVAMSGEGCAASSQAAPEAKYFFEEGEPDHCHGSAALRVDFPPSDLDLPSQALAAEGPSACDLEFVHEVSCRTRNLDDGTTEYVLECDICEEIGTAEDYEEADAIAQQHQRVTSELWDLSN